MKQAVADPGYGDARAPIGSEEWAKNWRLCFQSTVKRLPDSPKASAEFYDLGCKHRAWTLITDDRGKPFPTFDAFCAYKQPWGLGMDPAKFKAYLAAERGQRAMELETVDPGLDKGGHASLYAGATIAPAEDGMSKRKLKNLRAITRAPELIRELYMGGRITQKDAAAIRPKSPTVEQATRIVEARQEIEKLDRSLSPREFVRKTSKIVREALGKKEPTVLEQVRKLLPRLTPKERAQLRADLDA